MGKAEQRRRRVTLMCGIALTLWVIAADCVGLLRPLELWIYDTRARLCQHALRPPTDKLFFLDIDEQALEGMGKFPWPRAVWAEMLDEINLAQPKVVFLDVLFTEKPKNLDGAGELAAQQDQKLGDAVQRSGNVLAALTFGAKPRSTDPQLESLKNKVKADLHQTPQQLVAALRSEGAKRPDLQEWVEENLPGARRAAIRELLSNDPSVLALPPNELRKRVLPRLEPGIVGSPLITALDEEADQVRRILALRRFSIPAPDDLQNLVRPADPHPLIAEMAHAARYGGHVDYVTDNDGVLRSVPLFMASDGRLYPSAPLVIAAAMLDIDLAQCRIRNDQVTLPHPGGKDIVIPVRTHDDNPVGKLGLTMDIPWFGRRDQWQTMLDAPHYQQRKGHLSIVRIWDLRDQDRRLREAQAQTSRLWTYVHGTLGKMMPALADGLSPLPPEKIDDPAATLLFSRLSDALKLVEANGGEDAAQAKAALTAADQRLRAAFARQTSHAQALSDARNQLRTDLRGKAVLIGDVATGADVPHTSLHAHCPGVVANGVAANAIITGELWRVGPFWLTQFITLIAGVLTILAVLRLPPLLSALAALALVIGYSLINGYYLFDSHNYVFGAAGFLVCVPLVFACGILLRTFHETLARRAVERRFNRYADPALVSYLVEHPEKASLEGQVQELSVVFTDLVGFTALTEQLREKTVVLLNEYMGRMVPIIRRRRGYVNKFLGDGIMFFFGAPWENPDHARDAVDTILEMNLALDQFNIEQAERGMPGLQMRAGVSTGRVVVGDAGPQEGCDYTVLGDAANLAARLESANKVFGTRTLISQRTADLVSSEFFMRKVGQIRVSGRNKVEMVFEALARIEEVTPEQRELASLSDRMVNAFMAGDLEECLDAAQEMDQILGETRLSRFYRQCCETHRRDPEGSGFDGSVTLAEK